MPTMKLTRLRQIPSQEPKTKENRTTLGFGGYIFAAAVATWLEDIALDPKVQGSNPGGCSGGHHYKNSVGKHAPGTLNGGI